jgi:hypothetical protein
LNSNKEGKIFGAYFDNNLSRCFRIASGFQEILASRSLSFFNFAKESLGNFPPSSF